MNFALEVFALHLRNLLDFFDPPKSPRKTDACAHHFFNQSSSWKPPTLGSRLKQARQTANKQIAHLTTGRTHDPARKTWKVDAIVGDLKPTIERFARDADLICDDFQESVEALLAELG